jgi:hypothetical protein
LQRFGKHVVDGFPRPLMSATGYTTYLQGALKKDAGGQQLDVVQHSQPLLSRRAIYTAHCECNAFELVLAEPAYDEGERAVQLECVKQGKK